MFPNLLSTIHLRVQICGIEHEPPQHDSECPFCPVQLHSNHFFLCPNTPFRQELPDWQSFLSFNMLQWRSFIFTLFVCLRLWAARTNFFSATGKERIQEFFEDNAEVWNNWWYYALRFFFSSAYLSVLLAHLGCMGLCTLLSMCRTRNTVRVRNRNRTWTARFNCVSTENLIFFFKSMIDFLLKLIFNLRMRNE